MTEEARREMRARSRRGDARQFHLLMIATYPVFLAAAVGRSLAGGRRMPRRSVFEEARVSASTSIAFAFMG
jgi:hypothetical protein